MTPTPIHRGRVVRTFTVVGLILPAIITVVSLVLALAWRGALPDPIATHWGPGGEVDGTGPVGLMLVVGPLLMLGLPALLAATALPVLRRGRRGPVTRLLGATALALAVLLGVLFVGSLAIQRGLDAAADAPSIAPVIWSSYAASVVAGLAAWFVQPKQDTVREETTAGTAIALGDGEKAMWARTQSMTGWFMVLLVAAAILVGGIGVAVLPSEPAAGWLGIAVGVVIGLAALTFTTVTVTVSEAGLTVRGVLGWPRKVVALHDVESARVAQVNGIADFGGWGWRLRPGAEGVVLRDGEAIWVSRTSGRDIAVTVDDAATGAGLLTALAQRAATTSGADEGRA